MACAEKAAPRRVCVEFRNPTWMTPDNQAETLDFLASHRLPYVGVDMPQGHRDSIPPVLAVTDPDLAVVRMHGHSQKWDSKDIHERFGYDYSAGTGGMGAQDRRAGRGRRRDPRPVQQLLPRLRADQRPAARRPAPGLTAGRSLDR